jgi:phosphatidylglycerol:prolipoprotein diacylglycerol transferase
MIGGMPILSVLSGLGALIGLSWIAWQAPKKQAEYYIDICIVVLLGGLVGGRGVYAIVNWPYYQTHLLEIPQVWLGGLSAPGALMGATLTLAMAGLLERWSTKKQGSFGCLADGLLPMLEVLTILIWLACWLAGWAYGAVADAWWALPARDEWGAVAPRMPVQLMGAISALVLFWVLDRGRALLPYPGQAASLGLLGLALELFALSFLRADPSLVYRGLRLDAWGFLILAGVAMIWFLLSTCVPFYVKRHKAH